MLRLTGQNLSIFHPPLYHREPATKINLNKINLVKTYSVHLVFPNPEHIVFSVWISVMMPEVTRVQLVPVVGENPPISKTSLTTKQFLMAMLQN